MLFVLRLFESAHQPSACALPPQSRFRGCGVRWLCAPGACVVPLVGFCCVWPLPSGYWVQQMSPFLSFPCSSKGESQALSATVLPFKAFDNL
jgi:hypothetical protein